MGKKNNQVGVFKVFWLALAKGHKDLQRVYFSGEFSKRPKAMNWCRNHPGKVYFIEHPDGTVEDYEKPVEPPVEQEPALAGGLGSVDNRTPWDRFRKKKPWP